MSPVTPISSLPAIVTTTNVFQRPTEPGRPNEEADPFIVNTLDAVPAYVLEHGPLVHLNTNEPFWPASIEEHLRHTVLKVPAGTAPSTPIPQKEEDPCAILARPQFNHERCFLTAAHDVRPNPLLHPWLVSSNGKPGQDLKSSISPAFLILVDKSAITGVPNTIDAFWFFFYSFNLGPTVANIHFGNHIVFISSDQIVMQRKPLLIFSFGFREHCMMRFQDGKPKAVHLSAHADGASYTYECLEKRAKRPLIFSALGSPKEIEEKGRAEQEVQSSRLLAGEDSRAERPYGPGAAVGPDAELCGFPTLPLARTR
ncbi:hypothetical protein VP01_132g1 [Puccinia sorghi]|uniref:Uncharacterized protein n=1 Tax=Puccinia sorghi TaxID=27349 RepID=A0A0L6VMG6_9BASI|nr:hypothetical protein VP01_132g1 [Puccinia sorghi]